MIYNCLIPPSYEDQEMMLEYYDAMLISYDQQKGNEPNNEIYLYQ